MTRYAFLALLLVGAAGIVHVLMRAGDTAVPGPAFARYATGDLAKLDFAKAGAAAPEGSFATGSGEASLKSFAGRTILVNYWATWCPPCEQEMPSLGELQAARGGTDFEVVAISVDAAEDAAFARQRLGELGAGQLTFRHAPLDAGDIVYGAGVNGFPTTILYGPDGTEIARLAGEADWSSLEAVGFIDAVLGQTRKRQVDP